LTNTHFDAVTNSHFGPVTNTHIHTYFSINYNQEKFCGMWIISTFEAVGFCTLLGGLDMLMNAAIIRSVRAVKQKTSDPVAAFTTLYVRASLKKRPVS